MKLVITFIFLFCISTSVWSCSFPNRGAQYNRLIEVISTNDKSVYKFIVPSEIQGLDDLEVNLGYSPKNKEGIKFMREAVELNFKIVDGNAIGTFKVEPRENLLPFLHVMWWPKTQGLCGVAASSEFIG